MLSYDEMPEDNADLARIDVQFPYLANNTPDECPVSMDSLVEYVRMESTDGEDVEIEDLEFIRTAQVAECEYWIWRFCESDGNECFVTVARRPNGQLICGFNTSEADIDNRGNVTARFTPEQYMLGEYHEVF